MKIFDRDLCGALHEYGWNALVLEMDSELVSVEGAFVFTLGNEKERLENLSVVVNYGDLTNVNGYLHACKLV